MQGKITPGTMDDGFVHKLEELSGQKVSICIQCGTCAGSCPMSGHMEFSIRKVMHVAKLGFTAALEELNTAWTCASCHNCTVRCPRGIDVARVMEALRQIILRKNQNYIEPSQLPAETLKTYPQIAMVAGFRKLTS